MTREYTKKIFINARRVIEAKLFRKSLASAAIKAGFVVIGLVTTTILARTLGAEGLGVYTLALTILTFVALPAKAGMPQVVVRETSKALALGRFDLIKGLWSWAASYITFFSIVLAAAIWISIFFAGSNWNKELSRTLLVGIILIPLFSAGELRSACLRGLGHVLKGQMPDLIIRPFFFLVALITIFLIPGEKMQPETAMAMYAIASGTAFLVGSWSLWKNKPDGILKTKPASCAKEWTRATIPMAITNIFFLANTQVDILLIGYFLSATDVGLYRVAIQGSLLIVFGLQATKMVVEPIFSKLYAQRDLKALQRVATRISRFNMVIGILVVIILSIFSEKAISIAFGKDFLGATTPLLILCAGRMVGAIFGSSGHLLNMAGLEKQYSFIWIGSSIITLILNLIFIPIFGLIGAATSTATGLVIANLLSWHLAKVKLSCDCSPFGRWREDHG